MKLKIQELIEVLKGFTDDDIVNCDEMECKDCPLYEHYERGQKLCDILSTFSDNN